MKNKFLGLFVLLGVAACSKQTVSISLKNESDLSLIEKPVILTREQVNKGWKDGLFPLVTTTKNDTLAAQLDDVDGDGLWDELFLLVNFEPGEVKDLSLQWVKDQPQFEKRTSVRLGVRDSAEEKLEDRLQDTFLPHELPWVNGYQPYQADGPFWENDKVGFRSYLDGRNSKDVYGKKGGLMFPETMGKNSSGFPEDNYHVMADWGRDILSVGNSVGLGGISLQIGDKFRRLGVVTDAKKGNVDSTTFSIYEQGPIRSIANFKYKNWRPTDENRAYSLNEKIEIWPGSYGYKTTVTFDNLEGDETLLVGLVNSRTEKSLTTVFENNDWIVLATHDKQTYEKEWYLGLALVLPKNNYQGFIDAPKQGELATSFLAKYAVKAGEPISYYSIASWELADEKFTDEKYFFDYLTDFTKQLSAKINVTIK